jgi:hypothetical protein
VSVLLLRCLPEHFPRDRVPPRNRPRPTQDYSQALAVGG